MSKAILQNGVTQADYSRVIWRIVPTPGTLPEEVLVPRYYVHVAKQMKPGARIEVAPADGSWFMELYVRSATETDVNVVVLSEHHFDIPKATPTAQEEYLVKHRGPRGWSVIRKADKKVVFEDGTLEAEAADWITKQSLA